MSKKDYGEVICQAVDEIVRKRLEGITYDSTILCTIVDNSRKTEGIYTVSNNNTTKFDAYSNDDSYRINDNVYVQIPGGDWNEQKFILAKKKDKVEEPFIYKNPFASLVDITGNVIKTQLDSTVGLVANAEPTEGEDITQILLWDYQGSLANPDMLPFSAYSRLGISASFQSWLSPSCDSSGNPTTVNHGDYGLKLIITTINENTSTSDQATEGEYELYLNCADMIGNPYDFQTFYHQEKVFDISQLGNIQTMKLYFYQKPGTFINGAGELISATDFLGSPIAPNLFVAAPYITLGYDVNEFEKEKVVIYTLNPSTYSRSADENYNKKSINLRWIHQDEQNDELFSVDDTDDLNYEIRWYRYELGHSSADEYSGVYWKNYARKKKENGKWQKWVQDSGTWIDDDSTSFFSIELSPDVTLQEEKVKAIVIYKGHPYRSNILTLTNEKEVVSKPTVDAVQALSIVCKDNTYGNYRIYGQNGSLLDMSERSIERFWVPYFKSSLDNQDAEPGILTEAESVEWIIPTERTMIQLEDSFYEGAEVTEEKDTKRIHIIRKCNSDGSIADVNTQKYKIKSYYSQSYSDNIIQCKIVKDKITYTATKELTFGPAGTTGTDHTFILDFDDGVTALTIGSENAVHVIARLYDYENNEIDITNKEISWSWKTSDGKISLSNTTSHKIELQLIDNTITASYNILQAELKWGDWNLIAYLPIPIRANADQLYISGTTQVIYNSAGEIIDCARNPYRLYQYDTGEQKIVIGSAKWFCINDYTDIGFGTEEAYSPKIKEMKDKENNILDSYLSPLSFYVEGACEKVCVIATVKNDKKEDIVWSQPILIMQNRYPSAMLNQWDGSLNVGKQDPGTILAPRLVAGKKNGDNTFSGVVLGDWTPTNSDSSLTAGTGLFGYDKGEQSYGFRDDGTAFIGKSSAGRIEFYGDRGIIESSNYGNNAGMSINLKEGEINAHNFDLNVGYDSIKVQIGESSEGEPIYEERNQNISLTTKGSYPLSIGSNFSVGWDGTLHAKHGIFQGEITGSTIIGGTIAVPNAKYPLFEVNSSGQLTATKGNIGGWEIGGAYGGLTSKAGFSIKPDGTMVMGTGDGRISINLFGQDDKPGGSIVIGKGSTATVLDSAGLCVKKVSIYNIDENGEKKGAIAGHLGYVDADFGVKEIESKKGIGLITYEETDDNKFTPKNLLKVTDIHIGATTGTTYWYIKDGEWSFATKAIVTENDETKTLITGITCTPGEITIKAPESNTLNTYIPSEPGMISLDGAAVHLNGTGGSIGITNSKAIDTPSGVFISADGGNKKLSLSGDILTITNDAFTLSYDKTETALKVNVNTLNLTGTTGLDIKSGDALNLNGKTIQLATEDKGTINLTGKTINLNTENDGAINLQGTTVQLALALFAQGEQCTIRNLEVQNTLKVTNLTVAENGTTTGVYATLK